MSEGGNLAYVSGAGAEDVVEVQQTMAWKVAGGSEGTTYLVTYDGSSARMTGAMRVFSDMDADPFDLFKSQAPTGADVITTPASAAIAQADSVVVLDGGHYATTGGWDASPAPSFGGSASTGGAVDAAVVAVSNQVAGCFSHACVTGTGNLTGTTRTHSSGSLSNRMTGILAVFKAATGGGPSGRIMGGIANRGGLVGEGGIAGRGGGIVG